MREPARNLAEREPEHGERHRGAVAEAAGDPREHDFQADTALGRRGWPRRSARARRCRARAAGANSGASGPNRTMRDTTGARISPSSRSGSRCTPRRSPGFARLVSYAEPRARLFDRGRREAVEAAAIRAAARTSSLAAARNRTSSGRWMPSSNPTRTRSRGAHGKGRASRMRNMSRPVAVTLSSQIAWGNIRSPSSIFEDHVAVPPAGSPRTPPPCYLHPRVGAVAVEQAFPPGIAQQRRWSEPRRSSLLESAEPLA